MRRLRSGKLIRDRIPEIIARAGARCKVRRLGAASYLTALREKILEEARELGAARRRRAIINELIDLHELVSAYRRALGISPSRFRALAGKKRLARGGFRRRLFLEYTDGPLPIRRAASSRRKGSPRQSRRGRR